MAARLEGGVKEGRASYGGPPPQKGSAQVPGAAGPSLGGGRRAAPRALAKELSSRQKAPSNKAFQLPPAFEAGLQRQLAFLKRALNPAVLLEPLPPALRLSLSRNFGFVTKIFTQFVNPHQQKVPSLLSVSAPLTPCWRAFRRSAVSARSELLRLQS